MVCLIHDNGCVVPWTGQTCYGDSVAATSEHQRSARNTGIWFSISGAAVHSIQSQQVGIPVLVEGEVRASSNRESVRSRGCLM